MSFVLNENDWYEILKEAKQLSLYIAQRNAPEASLIKKEVQAFLQQRGLTPNTRQLTISEERINALLADQEKERKRRHECTDEEVLYHGTYGDIES